MSTTWNPADKSPYTDLSNGNLTAAANLTTFYKLVRATVGKSTGKWYFKVKLTAGANEIDVGWAKATESLDYQLGLTSGGWGWGRKNGYSSKWHNGELQFAGPNIAVNDIIMCAVDIDAHKIWWGVNGVWIGGADPAAGTGAMYSDATGTLYPALTINYVGTIVLADFGAGGLPYPPPTGFSEFDVVLSIVQRAHRQPYDMGTTLARAHRQPYEIRGAIVARHRQPYDLGIAIMPAAHRQPYALSLLTAHRQRLTWEALKTHRQPYALHSQITAATHRQLYTLREYTELLATHRQPASLELLAGHCQPYSIATPVLASHRQPYDFPDNVVVLAAHRQRYELRGDLLRASRQPYDLLARDPVLAAHRQPYSLIGHAAISLTGAMRLLVAGRPVALLQGEIGADESDYGWSARLTLAHIEDYARLCQDDAVTLDLYGEHYSLIIESKDLSRDSPAGVSAQIVAVSPAHRFAEPRAERISRTWDSPVRARAAAEEVLGEAIDWRILDWWLPAYRLAVDRGVPLDLVIKLAQAVGGVLESAQDGTLIARPLYPIPPAQWATATPDQVYTEEADILAVSESGEPARIVNRLRIADVEGSYSDRIEWTADADNPLTGTLRAYPSPWRTSVNITDTRGPVIALSYVGESVREEQELIEIVAGQGATRYPIDAIVAAGYEADDLGAVSFQRWTAQVVTSTAGYSLLRLTYRVRSLDYRAQASEAAVDAQFLLEDLEAA